MIKIITKGEYKIVVTKNKNKILFLDNQAYLWVYVKEIGELLVFLKYPHETQYILAQGEYVLYKVKKESKYIDLQHLELSINKDARQGYLLLTGLPNKDKIRSRIIPTKEIIGNRESSISQRV